MRRIVSRLALAFGLASVAIVAWGQFAGEKVARRGAIADDFYAAGGTVEIDATALGDVIVAAGNVSVEGRVQADVIAAGNTVTIAADVGDDVRAAGNSVVANGRVGDDAILAGNTLRLGPRAAIGGRAWLAGNEVSVAGEVQRELKVAAERVTIGGHIMGDANIRAREINILPSARFDGNLHMQSERRAELPPQAQAPREVTYTPLPVADEGAFYAARIFFYVMVAVTGVALVWMFPGFVRDAGPVIGTRFWQSLALGFAVFVATPVAAVLMMLTVVGLWLGLMVLALYFVALPVGFLVAVFHLGMLGARIALHRELGTRRALVGGLVAALLLLALVRPVPYVGGLVWFAVLLLGLGAVALWFSRQTMRTHAAARL